MAANPQLPQTPQRPMPGRFFNTPAHPQPPSLQPQPSSSFRLVGQAQAQGQTSVAPASTTMASGALPQGAPEMSLIRRAVMTIRDKLAEEARYRSLDSYLPPQGGSASYNLPTSTAWAPFQLVKQYGIPEEIFDQYNRAQVSTTMGIFAEIHYAWVAIDNSLYMWDYTHPAPELLSYEEAPGNITAVRLAKPRAGVFVSSIRYLVVVATTSDVHLLAVADNKAPGDGLASLSLYQTKMQAPCRGLNVTSIAGSAKTGRVFFAGTYDNDIYELSYQQEEKWFQNRCTKLNHTRKGFESIGSLFSQRSNAEHIVQLEVDDTRDTLWTLSSHSTIRAFHMRNKADLSLPYVRTWSQILMDTKHQVTAPEMLPSSSRIVSIVPVTAKEAERVHLVAITDTGCRLYFSGQSGAYKEGWSGSGVTSLVVVHVKFPPRATPDAAPTAPANSVYSAATAVEPSQALKGLRQAHRFPPGYFFAFVQRNPAVASDSVFMSAPDCGRILHSADTPQGSTLPEFGMWQELSGEMQDAGVVISYPGAGTREGFGNELALQFDQPTCELAVLTNSAIYSFRRRRLVDVFAATIKNGGGGDGLAAEIRGFAQLYGRGETVATALAVACGQASEVSVDHRVLRIADNDILNMARQTIIEHGGRPELDQNIIPATDLPSVDQVRPSPRHEGLAIYTSRLLRSVWHSAVILEGKSPAGGISITPGVPIEKLKTVQRDLVRLQGFLDTNRPFIEGLAGPEALGRLSTKQEEVALQAEHRAMSSMTSLISDVIEGIAFVCVLFAPEERVDEIFLMLSDETRDSLRRINFEALFCHDEGKNLAKDLVKAIVNRNIAAGSNVDTVTDALRRRCGSFCSPDDCVIFKAQEQLKRASDSNVSSEVSRTQLNEGLRLLQKVAGSLASGQLRWAVDQFINMQFFAGAVQLCLTVAQEFDRGNQALSWLRDGMPGQDNRAAMYESRLGCYTLIHQIIAALDKSASSTPEMIDGQYTVLAKRQREAYDVINRSQDELFQTTLYDWYLEQGQKDRLLSVESPFVIGYLERKSVENLESADMLWRYHAHYNEFIEAARVQLELAKSAFTLSLEQRIQYLSYAKTNASTRPAGGVAARSRQSRQDLLRNASDLLELSNIQSDILDRICSDERISDEVKVRVTQELNGRILTISELFNQYADQAEYYDICLLIYQVADHRNPSDIRTTWDNLIKNKHGEALQHEQSGGSKPFEIVGETVRMLGTRLHLAEATFPVPVLVAMLERYVREHQRDVAPAAWVPSLFLAIEVPFETLASALESMWYNQEPPFKGQGRREIAVDLLYVLERWCEQTSRAGGRHMFGGEEYAAGVLELIEQVQNGDGSDRAVKETAMTLSMRIRMLMR